MTDRERFEKLMQTISDRPGFDRLMNYIRKSDFYTAPASTRSPPVLRRWAPAAQPECI